MYITPQNRFSVAYSMYITPQNNMLSYIMSLQMNIFGVTTFTFHLKILFKKFSRQRAGYHLVLTKDNLARKIEKEVRSVVAVI
jgi:hypothetical protein